MTENDIKAAISSHFVQMIASRGGFKCSRSEPDQGVDLHITRAESRLEPNGDVRWCDTGEYVDVQLKCTCAHQIRRRAASFTFDLEAKNYNDLVHRRTDVSPLLLVLLVLPDDNAEWVTVGPQELIVRRSAYWYLPPADAVPTANQNTIAIEIQDANAVDAAFLQRRFEEIFA